MPLRVLANNNMGRHETLQQLKLMHPFKHNSGTPAVHPLVSCGGPVGPQPQNGTFRVQSAPMQPDSLTWLVLYMKFHNILKFGRPEPGGGLPCGHSKSFSYGLFPGSEGQESRHASSGPKSSLMELQLQQV